MRPLEEDIACAVDCDASVMISGESGAGKTFAARAIHQRSRRRSGPFIIANWPDITERRHPSRSRSETDRPFKEWFANADGNGTLLIDDIGKMAPVLQLELLRFTDRATRPELRLMTTAGTDLFARVQGNQFRSDLFYRLNVMHLKVPPLRDRREDIPMLFRHYLRVYARAHPARLSTACVQRLVAYPWPGNVAQLKATAETLAAQDLPRRLEPEDLPPHIACDR